MRLLERLAELRTRIGPVSMARNATLDALAKNTYITIGDDDDPVIDALAYVFGVGREPRPLKFLFIKAFADLLQGPADWDDSDRRIITLLKTPESILRGVARWFRKPPEEHYPALVREMNGEFIHEAIHELPITIGHVPTSFGRRLAKEPPHVLDKLVRNPRELAQLLKVVRPEEFERRRRALAQRMAKEPGMLAHAVETLLPVDLKAAVKLVRAATGPDLVEGLAALGDSSQEIADLELKALRSGKLKNLKFRTSPGDLTDLAQELAKFTGSKVLPPMPSAAQPVFRVPKQPMKLAKASYDVSAAAAVKAAIRALKAAKLPPIQHVAMLCSDDALGVQFVRAELASGAHKLIELNAYCAAVDEHALTERWGLLPDDVLSGSDGYKLPRAAFEWAWASAIETTLIQGLIKAKVALAGDAEARLYSPAGSLCDAGECAATVRKREGELPTALVKELRLLCFKSARM